MKAWGSGDEKVVAKNVQLMFNAGRSEDHARDPDLPWRWQSKSSLGQGVGGGASQELPPPPPFMESVPEVGKLHPMMPGSVIVASVPSGSHLAKTDIATNR